MTRVLIPRNCDGVSETFPCPMITHDGTNGYETDADVLVLGEERVTGVTPIAPCLFV